MSQDLVPTTSGGPIWTPPEGKYVRWILNGGIALLLGGAAVGIFNWFAPSVVTAIGLLQTILNNLVYLGLTAIGAFMLLWLAHQLFSPTSKLHQTIKMKYSSMINAIAWKVTSADPITPLTDFLAECYKKLAQFGEAFARYDGTTRKLQMATQQLREQAADTESKAAAARRQRGDNDPTFRSLSTDCIKYEETATKLERMLAQLTPIRDNIAMLRDACKQMVHDTETDIRLTKLTWGFAQDIGAIDKAARALLSQSQLRDMAQMAAQIVQDKYASNMGRLDNLMEAQRDLINTVDIAKGECSQKLIDRWNATAKPIALPPPTQQPMQTAIPDQRREAVSSLLR